MQTFITVYRLISCIDSLSTYIVIAKLKTVLCIIDELLRRKHKLY